MLPAAFYQSMTTAQDMAYLALDYGTRRIGVAKSDPTGLIASAITTLEVRSQKDALSRIEALLDEYQPAGVVVGYPIHDDGSVSEKCAEIDRFIGKLEAVFAGPIYRQDERMSSIEAQSVIHAHGKRSGKDKARIDRIAAVLILQRFLDERREAK